MLAEGGGGLTLSAGFTTLSVYEEPNSVARVM
jgi:hypothetical protein